MARIGQMRFRVTLDIGGARSLMRKSFADQLQRNKKTREAVVERYRGEQSVQCEDVVSGMMTAPVEVTTTFKVGFEKGPVRSATVSAEVVCLVPFAELEGASDPILIGLP